jgi:tRNA threonylcarbamoyl adenosine modification protein (Sua5/YciO/YrdC/YwlC family)
MSDFIRHIDNNTFKLVKNYLPGPYTFILPANSRIPKIFKNRKKTVGIRIPDHTIPLALVEQLGHPIITTSIHDEDEILDYTTDPELIHEKFKNQVDVVINGGFGHNVPSTVVDLTEPVPNILRQGIGTIEF